MTYTPQTWNNGPEGGTPVSAARLNYLEQGVAGVSADADAKAPLVHTHTAAQITSGVFAAARLPSATETAIGAVERATQAEASALTDTTRYISPAILANAIAAAIASNPSVQTAGDSRWASGGSPVSPLFTRLRQGILDPTSDTRVVALGSSTMNSGNVSFVGAGVGDRLAYRAGALSYPRLEDVTATVPAGPMRWWNGAVGGNTSANYYPTASRTALNRVAPQYVLHMIGSNDWANNVNPATTYATNVEAACSAIELANPGVVNVLIHQQGRLSPTGRTYTWSAYGDALRAIAANQPASRVVIDVDADGFAELDLTRGNRWGLVSSDLVHTGDIGHLLLANIIGRRMGIPSETTLIGPQTIFPTLPASQTVAASNTLTLFSIPFTPVAYPRKVQLTGLMYARRATASGSAEFQIRSGSPANTLLVAPIVETASNTAVPISTEFIIPQATSTNLELWANGSTGGLYFSGNAAYSRPSVTVTPA